MNTRRHESRPARQAEDHAPRHQEERPSETNGSAPDREPEEDRAGEEDRESEEDRADEEDHEPQEDCAGKAFAGEAPGEEIHTRGLAPPEAGPDDLAPPAAAPSRQEAPAPRPTRHSHGARARSGLGVPAAGRREREAADGTTSNLYGLRRTGRNAFVEDLHQTSLFFEHLKKDSHALDIREFRLANNVHGALHVDTVGSDRFLVESIPPHL